jgi:Ca2+-binding EF-hand superfamily protein
LLQSAAMGLASSLPEESAYAPFQALGLGYTEELVRSYKERDLDFGIDLPTIEGLTGLDRDQCVQLVESLAKNDPRERKLVNALALLSGACIAGEENGEAAASRIFDIFDFDARGQISRDELTILLLCSLRAANAIRGLQDEPDDDATEIISDAAFDQAIPPQGNPDVISKKEFLSWASRALRGIESAEQFVAAFSCGITPGIDNEETDLAAAKLQARIRGRNERLNPTAPPTKAVEEPAPEEPSPEEPSPEEPTDALPEDNEETGAAAAKLQARIRGRNERLNPTTPPAKTNAALVETPEADPPVERPSSAVVAEAVPPAPVAADAPVAAPAPAAAEPPAPAPVEPAPEESAPEEPAPAPEEPASEEPADPAPEEPSEPEAAADDAAPEQPEP